MESPSAGGDSTMWNTPRIRQYIQQSSRNSTGSQMRFNSQLSNISVPYNNEDPYTAIELDPVLYESNRNILIKIHSSVSENDEEEVNQNEKNSNSNGRRKRKENVEFSISNHYEYSKKATYQKFLSYFGMLSNSYYAKQLLTITIVIMLLNTTIVSTLLIIIPQWDIDHTFQSSQCKEFIDPLRWHGCVAWFNILLVLPVTSFTMFQVRMENLVQPGSKLSFYNFCLFFVCVEIPFQYITMILQVVFGVENKKCFDNLDSNWEALFVWAFIASILMYWCIWYQICVFKKYITHCSNQTGVGFGNNRLNKSGGASLLVKLRSVFWKKYQEIRDLQDVIYRATITEDVELLKAKLEETQRTYGTNFAKEHYGHSKLYFFLSISKHNPLHVACCLGYTEIVATLLDYGFCPNAFDKVFPFSGRVEDIFHILIDYLPCNAIMNRKDADDKHKLHSTYSQTLLTPTHCAVSNDNLEVVNILISKGADMNLYSKSFFQSCRVPPIFVVQSSDVADALIRSGANHLETPPAFFSRTIYDFAHENKRLSLCRVLEKWGGDFSLTPLHYAAASNDVKKVISLLDWGAIPDSLGEGVEGFYRRSPLHWACISGSLQTAKELIERGATVNIQDVNGMTPLHFASLHHHADIVKLLLSFKADAKIRDNLDRTCIFVAAENEGKIEALIREIVLQGGELNARCGPQEDTAMHIAMKRSNLLSSISLLHNGADIMKTNIEGKRPIDCTLSTDIQFAIKKEAGTRDVMISYTHVHRSFATKIRQSLEHNKITVWMDTMSPSGIGGGSVWREEVAKGIINAAVVLCILTEDYQKSPWCMKELALAKQVGTPIIALSAEGVDLTEELQVYLYTRQIIPFAPCITLKDDSDPKNIQFEYSARAYENQVNLLLDGIRDEVEKQRLENQDDDLRPSFLASMNRTSRNTLNASYLSATNEQPLVFIAHGDCHFEFLARIKKALKSSGYECYTDTGYEDMGERIRRAKDAILRCSAFVPILSDESKNSTILSDQLAFAEDKGKAITPILYTEPEFDPAKRYTLSRDKFFHFSGTIGFLDSYNNFEDHLASRVHFEEVTVPLLEHMESGQSCDEKAIPLRSSASSTSSAQLTRLRNLSNAYNPNFFRRSSNASNRSSVKMTKEIPNTIRELSVPISRQRWP